MAEKQAPNSGSFRPGVSGNPAGRPPKGQALTDLLRWHLARSEEGVSHRTRIVRKLIELAEAGDMDAIRVVLDRVDGRVKEQVDLAHGLSGATLAVMAEIARRMRE